MFNLILMYIVHLICFVFYFCYSSALATGSFDVVERIKSFHALRITWSGLVVDVKTELYILANTNE
jgi:hypothetical protein